MGQAKLSGMTPCSTTSTGPSARKAVQHGGGQAIIRRHPVRPGHVHARVVRRVLRVHAELAHEEQHLRHRGQDAPPAGRAARDLRARPSAPVAITGHMLVSGRLPGAMALGVPGVGSNHMTPLLSSTPERGSTTRLPMEESRVVVIATIIPSRSQAVRWVVQLSAARGSASPSPARRSA